MRTKMWLKLLSAEPPRRQCPAARDAPHSVPAEVSPISPNSHGATRPIIQPATRNQQSVDPSIRKHRGAFVVTFQMKKLQILDAHVFQPEARSASRQPQKGAGEFRIAFLFSRELFCPNKKTKPFLNALDWAAIQDAAYRSQKHKAKLIPGMRLKAQEQIEDAIPLLAGFFGVLAAVVRTRVLPKADIKKMKRSHFLAPATGLPASAKPAYCNASALVRRRPPGRPARWDEIDPVAKSRSRGTLDMVGPIGV